MNAIFAQRLKELRESCNLSQKQLAKKAKITGRAVGYYEAQQRSPTMDIALRLMDALDCTFEYLFGTKEERQAMQTKRAHAAT